MKSRLYILVLTLLLTGSLFAQMPLRKGSDLCSERKMSLPQTFFDNDSPNSPKHTFDVLDYKMNLDIRSCFISPYPRSFTGTIIVKFRIDTALSSINLNAVNTSLVIASVWLSGVSFTHTGNILNVVLNRVYNPGEITEVLINYSHNNVSDGFYGACLGGHLDLAKTMINDKINYDIALFYACQGGHLEIIKFIIGKGATNWNQGIEAACLGGHIKLVKLMAAHGAATHVA